VIGGGYLAEGSVFAGRYQIVRELGRGGVSVVYAARDTQVSQDVALKLLVPSPAAANQTRERMRREVNAVRRLTHPNIVAVYDFVEDGPYGAVIWSSSMARTSTTGCATPVRSPPMTSRASGRTWQRRSPPRIARASCIVTSSRRTF
jgi:serine/threonine protein kinase